MIKNILFKFGSRSATTVLSLDPSAMTIFVGPNNSGKSLVLREVEQYSTIGEPAGRKIVERITYELPNREAAKEMILAKSDDPPPGSGLREGEVWIPMMNATTGQATNLRFELGGVLNFIESNTNQKQISRNFLSLYTVRLDGRTRFSLTEPKPTGDLQKRASNHLMALFKDDDARVKIRGITADAFGLNFTVDPTDMQNFRIRMAAREPADFQEEQALDGRARAFHHGALDIADLSDGVKAFTGLVSVILSSDYRILLIDEPEAFLHPPLARKLGQTIAELAFERNASVFTSTHSADFLMGCVQSGKHVNIIRLTYKNGIATANLLSAPQLQSMMRDPLLRSTGVLSALFYEGIVVTESDADRAFYQEINQRLLAFGGGGAAGTIFLNAQNKQTIRRIIKPLREMGIPAVAVVDLDIIKVKGEFKALLYSCGVPRTLVSAWGTLRGDIFRAFEQKGVDPNTYGIEHLDASEKEAAVSLLTGLAEYGVFVVPGGALESWLRSLGVTGHAPGWLVSIFERIGSDPDSEAYLKPSEDDVWRFLRSIARWIADPHRHGMTDLEAVSDDTEDSS